MIDDWIRVWTDELEWSPGQLSRQRPVVCLGLQLWKLSHQSHVFCLEGWEKICDNMHVKIFFLWNLSQLSKEGKENNSFTCMLSQIFSQPPKQTTGLCIGVTTFTTEVPNSKHTTGLCRDNCPGLHSSVPTLMLTWELVQWNYWPDLGECEEKEGYNRRGWVTVDNVTSLLQLWSEVTGGERVRLTPERARVRLKSVRNVARCKNYQPFAL